MCCDEQLQRYLLFNDQEINDLDERETIIILRTISQRLASIERCMLLQTKSRQTTVKDCRQNHHATLNNSDQLSLSMMIAKLNRKIESRNYGLATKKLSIVLLYKTLKIFPQHVEKYIDADMMIYFEKCLISPSRVLRENALAILFKCSRIASIRSFFPTRHFVQFIMSTVETLSFADPLYTSTIDCMTNFCIEPNDRVILRDSGCLKFMMKTFRCTNNFDHFILHSIILMIYDKLSMIHLIENNLMNILDEKIAIILAKSHEKIKSHDFSDRIAVPQSESISPAPLTMLSCPIDMKYTKIAKKIHFIISSSSHLEITRALIINTAIPFKLLLMFIQFHQECILTPIFDILNDTNLVMSSIKTSIVFDSVFLLHPRSAHNANSSLPIIQLYSKNLRKIFSCCIESIASPMNHNALSEFSQNCSFENYLRIKYILFAIADAKTNSRMRLKKINQIIGHRSFCYDGYIIDDQTLLFKIVYIIALYNNIPESQATHAEPESFDNCNSAKIVIKNQGKSDLEFHLDYLTKYSQFFALLKKYNDLGDLEYMEKKEENFNFFRAIKLSANIGDIDINSFDLSNFIEFCVYYGFTRLERAALKILAAKVVDCIEYEELFLNLLDNNIFSLWIDSFFELLLQHNNIHKIAKIMEIINKCMARSQNFQHDFCRFVLNFPQQS
ncbi:MAG: hypothetical protein MHMPM18_001042 [Marteilia pararefringens]